MAAGIQIFGEHGFAQIDQDYWNLALRSSGTVALNSGTQVNASTGPITGLFTKNVTVTAEFPVIALRPALGSTSVAGACGVRGMFESGGNKVIVFNWMSTDTSKNFEYFVFDKPQLGNPSRFIEVLKEDGSFAFTDAYKYLKIIPTLGAIPPSGYSYGALFNRAFGSHTGVAVHPDDPNSTLRVTTIATLLFRNTNGSIGTTAQRVSDRIVPNGTPLPPLGWGPVTIYTVDLTGV